MAQTMVGLQSYTMAVPAGSAARWVVRDLEWAGAQAVEVRGSWQQPWESAIERTDYLMGVTSPGGMLVVHYKSDGPMGVCPACNGIEQLNAAGYCAGCDGSQPDGIPR